MHIHIYFLFHSGPQEQQLVNRELVQYLKGSGPGVSWKVLERVPSPCGQSSTPRSIRCNCAHIAECERSLRALSSSLHVPEELAVASRLPRVASSCRRPETCLQRGLRVLSRPLLLNHCPGGLPVSAVTVARVTEKQISTDAKLPDCLLFSQSKHLLFCGRISLPDRPVITCGAFEAVV